MTSRADSGLIEELMSFYAENGKSADPAHDKIAGKTMDRLSYNLQAAVSFLQVEFRIRLTTARDIPARRRAAHRKGLAEEQHVNGQLSEYASLTKARERSYRQV